MTREKLQKLLDEFCDNSPKNYLGMSNDKTPEELERFGDLKGMKFFDRPVFSIGRADNPGFALLKQPGIVGEHHLMPQDWLPEAKTVISIASPHSRAVVDTNKKDPRIPSKEWLYSRSEGQHYLYALSVMVRDALIADGHKAVTPYVDKKYMMSKYPGPVDPGTEHIPRYSSNWSDRHVAYLNGLGTFGRSSNFISKIGSAVRINSIITDWDIEADEPDYDDWLGYCNDCGACRKICPSQAILSGQETLKDIDTCWMHTIDICGMPRISLACGKCQVFVPCAFRPMKKK